MSNPQMVSCACGCGDTFPFDPQKPTRKYIDRSHQLRGDGESRKKELTRARAQVQALEAQNATLAALVERYAFVSPGDTSIPEWMQEKPTTGKAHHATPVLMLSDLHLDEVVDLHEMDGINAYDRDIAHQRFERVINGTVKLLRRYVSGVHFDGIVVPLLGDIITGVIHDELARTNVAPPPATIAHWVPHLASGLTYLADELGAVHVPVVDGNHDRFYHKLPSKEQHESSLAWIVYNWLADHLRNDDRITFSIGVASEQLISVYDTTFLLSHGDGFRSSGGVGGIYPSLLKWVLRAHDLYSLTKRDFDYVLMGHWHQALWGQDFIVNGSLKGYDQYAKRGKFKFEVPQQQLFVVTPERGITQRLSVFAD